MEQYDDSDCGVVCIATIAKHYGLKVSVAKLREMSGTDKNGNNGLSLIYTLDRIGFESEGIKLTKEEFYKFNQLPAIFHIIRNNEFLHYVVVYKITNDEVIVSDPAEGILKLKPEVFLEKWTNVVITAEKGENFIKGDLTQNFFKKFFLIIKTQKKLLKKIFLLSLIYTGCGISGAYFYKILVDIVLPKGKLETLTYLSVGFILLNVLKILLNIFRTRLLVYMGQNIDMKLVLDYYKHIMYLPVSFFETRKTGEIISRFKDAFLVRDAISGATLSIMIDILMVICGALILINQNIFLFLVSLSMVLLYAAAVYIFLKPFQKLNREQMEQNSKLTSILVESVSGIETIKATNTQEYFSNEISAKLKKLLKIIFNISNVRVIQSSLISFIKITGTIVILWVGAYFIIKGDMTIGELFTYNALVVYFLDPVSNMIDLQTKIQSAVVAADRLGEILELDLEKEAKINKFDLKNEIISIKNLNFKYGMGRNILNNININVNRGEKIAIVGESGSGKTTLAKLIMAFYYPNEGNIKINNIDTNDISYKYLREKVAYVSQNIFLFSKSIEENLKLGFDVTDINYKRILEITKCNEFIDELYLKDKTILAENGSSLSGGQRQRLSIARVLMRDPEIMILDEATSNLDSETESAIVKSIFYEFKYTTSIIIAHRLTTISRCDKIFVMEKGRILECGSHEELMMNMSKYYSMWESMNSGLSKNKI
ncbi:MAG: peptidase domain-containing ABC transporter [Clostridiales bacterium]